MAAPTIPVMELTVVDRPVRRLTIDEAMRMLDAGVLHDAKRLELLRGVLTEKPMKGPEHLAVEDRLHRWLAPGVAADRYVVRTGAGVAVPDRVSLPEPDFAVVPIGNYAKSRPKVTLLAIEVAVSSLKMDMTFKPALYAEAGIPEYWVVDARHRKVEVFQAPVDDAYATRRTYEAPGTLTPQAIHVEPLDLAELFAGF